jgi:hypothetical protein
MDAIPETLISTLFMDLRFRELLANLHCDPNILKIKCTIKASKKYYGNI